MKQSTTTSLSESRAIFLLRCLLRTATSFCLSVAIRRALTHGIHKYPAKFFPELPRWIIKRYSEKWDMILDPFMGSGTTNLEASLLGRHSIGVDVDPFSRFIASVKTTVCAV